MIVRLSEYAADDIGDGVIFYDRHGQDVGAYFQHSILDDVTALEVVGGVHPIRHGYHCMPAKRFPFAIYYSLEEGIVTVAAVLDERRDPKWIRQRLARG